MPFIIKGRNLYKINIITLFMTNSIRAVWKLLNANPCVRITMNWGLTNTRANARYILKERKFDASLDAVINAITWVYTNFKFFLIWH